jgi:hypothetical protein
MRNNLSVCRASFKYRSIANETAPGPPGVLALWVRLSCDLGTSETAESLVYRRPRLLVVAVGQIPEGSVQCRVPKKPHDRPRRDAVVVQRRHISLSQLVQEDVMEGFESLIRRK